MSRRYATLTSLMTGRGGVHEVRPASLVESVAVADGVHHVIDARSTPSMSEVNTKPSTLNPLP